jgi:hypothetical protein
MSKPRAFGNPVSICAMKRLASFGGLSLGLGLVAFALTFASGFGPCGPSTGLGAFLISFGFVATMVGLLMMAGAILRAAFGSR